MNAGAAGRAGFIGAGRMGAGMAGCLIRAGRPLALLAHRNRAPLEALLAMGATEAATATELAADADVIYTCVSNAEVVELLGTELLPALRPGQVWIDATTSLPETSKRIAQLVAKTGAVFADAPIEACSSPFSKHRIPVSRRVHTAIAAREADPSVSGG